MTDQAKTEQKSKVSKIKGKTSYLNPENYKRDWFVIDAKDQTLGRLASRITPILMGKHKPSYTAHQDFGDFVVVLNADKVKLTGNKLTDKVYYWYTNHIGGAKGMTAEKMLAKRPTRLLQLAIEGMMPKNKLAHQAIGKLKLYAGDKHPHEAQNPKPLTVTQ